ncbi:MFS transporter [Ruania rhizosphaerae]|uniref:MFS transporter n=1 Tax=Ruania rhizosphaerae TaxID=1840413 RepID=UPI001359AB95|nr:MFS transporter [Ruania rhizosphaerae]
MNRKTRLLMAVVCGTAVASVYAGQPVLGQMGRDLGVAADATGWFIAVGQVGYLFGLVLLVPLGDMLNRRRLIAGHLAVIALGLTVAALAQVAWIAFVGLAMAGVFAVVVQIAVALTSALSAPAERGRNLGIVTSGVVVGILGSRILAGALADLWGWRSVYAAIALLSVLLCGLALRALPEESRTGGVGYGRLLRTFAGLFADPLFLSRGVIAFLLFASFGALWSGMALPLGSTPWHLSEAAIGLFGVAGLAGALGAARAGRWADRGNSNRITGAAVVLLLSSWAAIAGLGWSLLILAFGILLLDFAVQAAHVSNQHILTTSYPTITSTVIGAYMVFYSTGSAFGAVATTAAYGVSGWTGSSVLGAVLAAAALAAWALGSRALRRGPVPRRPDADRVTAS